jgi:hypothetical protein
MTKVYAFKAHQLFLQRKLAAASDATLTTSSTKLWPRADFLEAWSTAVPGLDVPHEGILQGIALETAGIWTQTITTCYTIHCGLYMRNFMSKQLLQCACKCAFA